MFVQTLIRCKICAQRQGEFEVKESSSAVEHEVSRTVLGFRADSHDLCLAMHSGPTVTPQR